MQPQLLTKINFHPRCSNCNAEGESYTEYFHATEVQQEMYRGWNGVNGWFRWIESHAELSSILTRCEGFDSESEDTEVILETDMTVALECGCIKRVQPELNGNSNSNLQQVATALRNIEKKKKELQLRQAQEAIKTVTVKAFDLSEF